MAIGEVTVRGTALSVGDPRDIYRQKIARITLDSMVQFVGLLDAEGTVLEINKVALDAVGIRLGDVEGRPFWTTFWWQVSPEINSELRDMIRRAAAGEFVRWDAEIYGRAGGKETIIIDASLMPVTDERGQVVFIAAEGRDITEKKAYEREIARQREELAKLDELKTAFFANISHEFRTPLTLMMGPLEDAIADSKGLSESNRERLDLAHRNSLRLLKLVNTLLDFSRIEAGRIEASYAPVDLAAFTAELASVFRSAIERAGMRLSIDCSPLAETVHVDRDMWEKIVLNLLSNAFKFTFEGEIGIALKQVGAAVELTVSDTGTGIPPEEIPRLFERFHRAKSARGRSYEGSGIGLALVQELVKLHGGTVRVESEVDRGSRFIVTLPVGIAHLPADRIEAPRSFAQTAVRADAFVTEVLRWLPNPPVPAEPMPEPDLQTVSAARAGQRIVLADDNADMRDYVQRLLTQSGYEVEPAVDGRAALAAIRRQRPDLVLADVMMPGLDGFGLLRALRDDPDLAGLPVVLLSARAGEEARIEGLEAGADDYLVKPFSARELVARIESHLGMARLRDEASEAMRVRTAQFETLLNRAPIGVYMVDADFRIRHVNPVALPVFGEIEGGIEGRDFAEVIHILWRKEFADEVVRVFRHTLETGEPYVSPGQTEFRADRERDEHYEWRLDRILLPDGRFGVVCYFRDISHLVEAENTRQLLVHELNHRVKNTLANVQAIAQQTLRGTRDPAEFVKRFSGRIQSLARIHSLLTQSTWQGTDLQALIRDQLVQETAEETRVSMHGPGLHLDAQMALHLAMVIHELGTNSAKYGALSSPEGRLSVSWSIRGRRLHLKWSERGGPPISAPVTRGFGTTLIEQSAKGQGGAAHMLVEAEGVTWEIILPLPHPQTAFASEVQPAGGARPRAVPPRAPAPLAGLRLLVIEDEPLIALDHVERLRSAGAASVNSTGVEAEALRVIEEGTFDAALLDANLHGRPVDPIAAALARHRIPFVFVTGYGRQALPESFRQAPVLTKPFRDDEMIAAIVGLPTLPPSVRSLKA